MITRRKIVIAFGATAVAPFTSFAQQQKVYRVGFLGSGSASGYATEVGALRAGLRDLGYEEGKNLAIEFRWVDGKYDRLSDLAADLVRLKIDVLVTQGMPAALAAKRATTTIPIVMAIVFDAISSGLVASLERPGGNITGSSFFGLELSSKRIELIKEVNPRIKRVAILLNSDNSQLGPIFQAMEISAKAIKIELQQFGVRGPDDIEGAFAAMTKSHADAVVVLNDGMLISNTKMIAEIAAKRRLPAIGFDAFAEAGGLMSYGANLPASFHRAAYFVDRILKGAKPADLPVEQPTRFDLVVNMKTAKALGIRFPQSILARATKVIE